MKYLVQNGAQIDARSYTNSTPLMYASTEGHLEIVKYLTQNGAQIDARDSMNWTPLTRAFRITI